MIIEDNNLEYYKIEVTLLLIPRAPGIPRSSQMDGDTISTHKGSWFSRYTCKKASEQGIRTHPPMVLLAIVRERDINQLAFYQVLRGYSVIPFFFVRRCIYTASGVLFLSLMARRYFMFVMMTFGGSMAITTLLAAVRNRGRWCCCLDIVGSEHVEWSWEVTSCHFDPSFHSADDGTWAMALIIVIACKTRFTLIDDPDDYVRVVRTNCPDALWSGCIMKVVRMSVFCQRRLLFLG